MQLRQQLKTMQNQIEKLEENQRLLEKKIKTHVWLQMNYVGLKAFDSGRSKSVGSKTKQRWRLQCCGGDGRCLNLKFFFLATPWLFHVHMLKLLFQS